MTERTDPPVRLPQLRRLDVVAILFACLLSLVCLAKGAVHDFVVAIALLSALPLLGLAALDARHVHPRLQQMGLMLLAVLSIILVLQLVLPAGTDLWTRVQAVTGHAASDTALLDRGAWFAGLGRLLFFVVTFGIALFIGASESSARIFLLALMVSGTLCIAVTFFSATDNGVPVSTFYSYHHGFVNPNNAAAYLGLMLLVALAQAVRFFRSPATTLRKSVIGMIDGLSFPIIVKGCFILFALLIALAGLFMTGSRGGVLVTMVTSVLFLIMVACKTSLKPYLRNLIIAGTVLVAAALFLWSFANYGQVITNTVEMDGASANSRFDIFAAVLPMIHEHPLLGTGLGSFPGSFQHYRPVNVSSDGIIDKAHDSYLEFAAEMGVPALMVLLIALGWMGFALLQGYREREERYVKPALGFVVWLFVGLFSLMDFPLQIPGIAALAIAITTICVSQGDRRFSEPAQRPDSKTVKKRVRIRKRSHHKPIV